MTFIPGQRQNNVPENIGAGSPPRGSVRANTVGPRPAGAAGGVLGGYYPNPTFKEDMVTQAEADAEALVTLAKIRAHVFLHL